MQSIRAESVTNIFSSQIDFPIQEVLHTTVLDAGIPCGAITQICGFGKIEAAVQIIKDNSEFKAAWIESEIELNPLPQFSRDLNLTHIIYSKTGEHMIGACIQLLKSNQFPIVVIKTAPLDDFLLRKLQLAAEKYKSALVILTEDFSASWPISLMLKAHRNLSTDTVSVEILRRGSKF